MKAFTKLVALLMTLSILLLSFSACNKKKPEPQPDSSTPDDSSAVEPSDDDSDDDEVDDDDEMDDDDEIWDDEWEDDDDDWDDDEDDDDDEPDLVEIAMQRAKARTVTPSNGIKLNERISFILSPLDLGADRTGKEDCTELIQACLNAADALGGGTVFLPAGYYRVEENSLTVPSGVTLRGEWVNPDETKLNDKNRGTVLMAYAGRGNALDSETGFISLKSAATLRNISVWYPEQSATNPQPYPNTIKGTGHTVVMNVTLYNSYKGFYNSSCSSMLIRGFYGTVLNMGIFGSEAYDIPRIEKVRLDTKYWEESNLPNSPKTTAEKSWLQNYTRNNVIGVKAGRQDWGYWYDIYTNNVRYGCMLVDGNDSIGKLVTRNTKVGIYIENMSYPGLEVSYSDLDATQAGIYYNSKGNETLAISNTIFRNSDNAIRAVNPADYAVMLSQCTFENWQDNAVFMDGGNLNVSNTKFSGTQPTFKVSKKVNQAMLVGNTFAGKTLFTGTGWSESDKRIVRDDSSKDIPLRTDNYSYGFAPQRKAATNRLFDVADYGAVAGDTVTTNGIYRIQEEVRTPVKDSTAAIQAALNAAKNAGGGIVYLHGGYYRVNGYLTVPTGVELRGTFEGPHYGNGTMQGTQICAYGGKGNANGTPLITMQKNSGATGFTVYYPEQGLSDKAVLTSEKVKAYPASIRANAGTWIQNVCFTGAYVGIDAMTNKCDGIVISDVTGAVMSRGLVMGHGTNGGWVQNFHFNYSSWSGNYPMAPDGKDSGNKIKDAESGEMIAKSRGDLLTEFAARKVTGVELGDCKNVKFFSCFSISINTQIKLVEDPYTKGSFVGNMWGFAFDACHDGIYAESGNAQLNLYESMGVFNQRDSQELGGHNVHTTEKFTGTIGVWNTDAWSPNARGIAFVKGGTVNYINCFPWCVYQGECFEGGTLNVLGTTFVANNDSLLNVKQIADKWDIPLNKLLATDWVVEQGAKEENNRVYVPNVIYHAGAKGKVIGNINCKQTFYAVINDKATVEKKLIGAEVTFDK